MKATEHKDPVVTAYWPVLQSLELVRAPCERVADALRSEIERTWTHCRELAASWVHHDSLESWLRSLEELTRSRFVVFPTHSEWSALWFDTPSCDGYDSLAYNLSRLHDVDTLHFSSSDTDGPQLAGTTFQYRARGSGEPTRTLYCCKQGSHWRFIAGGTPLPGEPVERYDARIKRERMNEAVFADVLAQLGAQPWREEFYDFTRPCYELRALAPDQRMRSVRVADLVTRT